MTHRPLILIAVLILLAACAPTPPPAAPTVQPFPTMTVGSRIAGVLPSPPPASADLLANPATAVAAASLPTTTPDYTQCPPVGGGDVSLANIIASGVAVSGAITTYLNSGGVSATLEIGLSESSAVNEVGVIRNNFDLTGEGTPEVLVAFSTPEQGGVLLLYTCENGRYVLRYQNPIGGGVPQVLRIGDMNNDNRTDLLATVEQCSDVDGLCQYKTVVITWDGGTFVNLLNSPPDGDIPPEALDVDNDSVLEVVTQQQGSGNSQTGPIRTGSQIYDWNGVSYVLSLSQPNDMRYLIQVVHEGDRAFREESMNEAARLYLYAYEDGVDQLGYWFGGEERDILRSYLLYRLLLTFTFAENGDPLSAYEQTRSNFLNLEDAPIYARMSDIYWNAYQESNNLNVACQPVLEFVERRQEALELLNRYGTRNPTYTAESLCPF